MLLAVLGGLLIYLAPGDFVAVMLLIFGIAIELDGIALERRS